MTAFGITTSNSNPGPAVVSSANQTQTPSSSGGEQYGQFTSEPIAFYGGVPIAQQAATVDLLTQLGPTGLNLIPANTSIQSKGAPINVTAATLALTAGAHGGRVVTLNKASGIAITLPPATGSGVPFNLQIGTTITSIGTTITTGVTGAGSDAFQGIALTEDGGTMTGWPATGTLGGSDVITLNGSTTGGFIGDTIELVDVAAGFWMVKMVTKSTGTAATPFSHV